ncbi:MAG: hypothetical protein AAGG07_09640 [Planctomycetota bacterium]
MLASLRRVSPIVYFGAFAVLMPLGGIPTTLLLVNEVKSAHVEFAVEVPEGYQQVWNTMRLVAAIAGPTLVLLGLGCLGMALYLLQRGPRKAQGEFVANDAVRYQRHLVGIGYSLLLSGLLLTSLIAAMLYWNLIEIGGARSQESIKPEQLTFLLILSTLAAVVGSLFFVANSLRKKRDAKQRFSSEKFWGGLWFRVGEAVLFSLVVFWLIWKNHVTSQQSSGADAPLLDYSWLPILCLLIGMFVTSGEMLIFAIARGLFRAVAAFFGVEIEEEENGGNRAPPGGQGGVSTATQPGTSPSGGGGVPMHDLVGIDDATIISDTKSDPRADEEFIDEPRAGEPDPADPGHTNQDKRENLD